MKKPTPKIGEFELVNALVKHSRRAFIFNLAFAFIAVLCVSVAAMVIVRPLPVVVRSDDPQVPAILVRTGDVAVREVDAKRFFVTMANKLHGWNSATVLQQLREATFLMTSDYRRKYKDEVVRLVDTDPNTDPSGKTTLLSSYVTSRLRHEFKFDWPTVKCGNTEGLWYCLGTGTLVAQPLIGDPVDEERTMRNISIRARFRPVPATLQTLDGLLVEYWEVTEKK